VKVQLLGPVQALADDGTPLDIRGARPRALLARLALAAGEVVSTGTLVADLWGDRDAAPSTNALHTLVSRLRRDVGGDPALTSHSSGYQLLLDRPDVDALAAEDWSGLARTRLAARDWVGAGDAARAGLRLFRGPALADIGDPPYAAASTAALDQVRLALVEDDTDARLSNGELPDLAELDAAARAHPLRERLQGGLIRALYAAGRQADALAAYERTRRQLVEELGVDPSPALEQIHLAVLRQDADLVPAARPASRPSLGSNLRTALTSFVGRDREVTQILAALRDNRLVTVVGPGGAGKTRLALEAGHHLADQSSGGVWLVELAPVHDPLDLPHAVLATLGLREKALLDSAREGLGAGESADAVARLVSGLAGAQALIVLDNCEHLISAVADLADTVLAACPRVRLLATSREPLGIIGETLCPLPPLDLPANGADTAAASACAAVRLFVDRAAAVHPGFAVDESSVASVVSIVRRLDGLPLAIELAAARMRAMSPQQIAARLDDRFRLLTGGSRTALPRHRTLLAVVEWSWDLLEKPERTLLQRLAVFSGPVSLETVEQVCADDDLARPDVLDLLATLVDKSLVDAVGADEVHYRLLETVRAFGADRLTESGEAAVVRDRHAAYLLALVETADPLLRSAEQLAWLARLDALRDDVIAALRWCIDSGQADAAVRFVASLGWYLHLRGMTTELGHWPREALAIDGEVDPTALTVAHAFLAMGAASDGDLATGASSLHDAVTQAALVPDKGTGPPLIALLEPATMMFSRAFDEGISAVRRTVDTHPDAWTRGVALILLGHAQENAGEVDDVPGCYEQAFTIFSQVGERWGQAIALSSLGEVQEGQGDYPAALAGYERALAYLRALGTADDVTMTLVRLARMRLLTGDRDGAAEALAEARETADQFNQPAQSAIVEVGYAGLARADGDLAEAERRLRRVMPEAGTRTVGPLQLHGMVASALAVVVIARGELDEARELLSTALAYGRRSRDVPVIAEVVGSWAALAAAAGDPTTAARIVGYSTAVRGIPLPPVGDTAELAEQLRRQLGGAAFAAAYDEGAALDRTRAVESLMDWAGLTADQLDALASWGEPA
jgi:predicted ATPase/DNA-binding SARP family transcriptional activator